jgi:hypothetical protein
LNKVFYYFFKFIYLIFILLPNKILNFLKKILVGYFSIIFTNIYFFYDQSLSNNFFQLNSLFNVVTCLILKAKQHLKNREILDP